MAANIYDIDFKKLIGWFIPVRLRTELYLVLSKSVVTPVIDIYQTFLRFRKQKLYELGITPQVCSLERMLNDRYDYTQRRIRIDDSVEYPPIYLYQDIELHAVDLYTDGEDFPIVLFTDGEITGEITDDFIVLVPIDITFIETEMRSLIMIHRLPGMRFKIQRI